MAVVDTRNNGEIGWVDDLHSFGVWLSPYGGLFLVLRDAAAEGEDLRQQRPGA